LPHKSGDYYFSFYSAFLANPKHIFWQLDEPNIQLTPPSRHSVSPCM
jgi:hypothetical protein